MAPHLAPHVVGGNNFLSDTKKGKGAKNSLAVAASYPAFTFFLRKIGSKLREYFFDTIYFCAGSFWGK